MDHFFFFFHFSCIILYGTQVVSDFPFKPRILEPLMDEFKGFVVVSYQYWCSWRQDSQQGVERKEGASVGPCTCTGVSLPALRCGPWNSLSRVRCPGSLTSVKSWSRLCWVSGTEHLLSRGDWSKTQTHQFGSVDVPTGMQTVCCKRLYDIRCIYMYEYI